MASDTREGDNQPYRSLEPLARRDLLVLGCFLLGVVMTLGVVLLAINLGGSNETVVESADQSALETTPDVHAVAPRAPRAPFPSATTGSGGPDTSTSDPSDPTTTGTTPSDAADPLGPSVDFPVEGAPGQTPLVGSASPPLGSPLPPLPPSPPATLRPPTSTPSSSSPPTTSPPDVTGPVIADGYQLVDCAGLICLGVLSTATDASGVDPIEIYFSTDVGELLLVASCPGSPCDWTDAIGYGTGTALNYVVRARDGVGNWSQTPVRTIVL